MFKSFTIPFIAPKINTRTVAPRVVGSSTKRASSSLSLSSSSLMIPALSIFSSILVVGLIALQLYWVNTYSAKGVAITDVQNSIVKQTELQKKLLYQQAQLNASITFSDVSESGLVPVVSEEFLTPSNQLTQR